MDDESKESREQDDTTEGDRVTGMRLTQKQGIDYRDYERNDNCYLRQGWCELNLTHGTNKKDVRRPNGGYTDLKVGWRTLHDGSLQ